MKTAFSFLFLILFAFKINAQEIKAYNFDVKIDVVSKQLHVKGAIDIDFKNSDSISLMLWKNSNIHSIISDQKHVSYHFDTISPSPIMYIPNGGKLIIYKQRKSKEKQSIIFDYDCDMHELSGWAKSFSDNWIELNCYSAWFPLGSGNFTSKLRIWIDDKYKVTGSGIVKQKNDHWEITQPWTGFDNVVIASKNLKSRILHDGNSCIETNYSEFSEQEADSIISECRYLQNLYQNLLGKKDRVYLKFIMAPFSQGGGYSRKNFVSLRTKKFDLYTCGGIGHELAHFWWSNANTTTWEDWLNEAFAEYSMLIYFRERFGISVFDKKIEEYKKRSMNTPPIFGIDRNAPEAYVVLYEKGSLILHELEQKIGKEQFIELLREVVNGKVKTTSNFLELVEKKISVDVRQWLENKIKTT
ncbi:MAG TPA: M1 family aminopeptidase [Paludibacter sp.]|nr:M1 family aminopeptidase [Paludibacter sp.]